MNVNEDIPIKLIDYWYRSLSPETPRPVAPACAIYSVTVNASGPGPRV